MFLLNPNNAATFVPPSGSPTKAQLVIVGEQPGVQEIRQGKPFIGPAGTVLMDCLAHAGLNRAECYLTNVIKDLDRKLPFYYDSKRASFTAPGESYVAALKAELEAIPCKFILAAGNVALNALTSRSGITKWRGSVIESTLVPGKWVIPCLHPATVIPPKNVFTNKNLIIFDIKRAVRHARRGHYEPPTYNAILRPTFDESMAFLDEVLAKKPLTAFDIEIFHEEVSCISFAWKPDEAISIAFCDDAGDVFSLGQEALLWLKIAQVLEDLTLPKLGQNLTFDCHFLLRRYGIKTRNIHDTMIAQQQIAPDYPKGLDFITVMHTELPYYKDDGKRWFKVGGAWQQLWHYNALDSLVCIQAFPNQLRELDNLGIRATYDRQRNIIPPLVYMMEHGIRCDIPGIKVEYSAFMAENEQLQVELDTLAGKPLNPRSSKQLIEYFYGEKKQAPYKKKGSVTADNDAMKRLSRKGFEEARLIQRMRKNTKLASTYLDEAKFDQDGRIRCSANPVGTRYSRISTSKNIFGTGMNLQNWPAAQQRFLLADLGYVGYAIDLGQAENRIVAYVGDVEEMIYAFENGVDVHSLTASSIFNKPIEEVSRKKGSSGLGDGKHSERDWGKRANHGLNYGLTYRRFSFDHEIPERQGKLIVDGYHRQYPRVREGFHKHVENQLYRSRTVTNLMGRVTPFMGRLDHNTFKEAYSCIPQGTVGDIINERGMSFIYDNPDKFGSVELLNQVHDEIVFQIPLSVPWTQHAEMLIAICQSLETPLKTHTGREFVIPADLTVFKRFKHGTELKLRCSQATIAELAEQLETTWDQHKED